VTTTLGTSEDMQRLEVFEGEAKKRFMLHYNFPPFSVGEVAFLRGAGRREVRCGKLRQRAAGKPDEQSRTRCQGKKERSGATSLHGAACVDSPA